MPDDYAPPRKKAPRIEIPKAVKEKVLAEYNHRCSVCGKAHPQLHHINEDRTDNAPLNLMPLCPNCHLSDQHNPTRMIEVGKLQLFRLYKDPCILSPEFDPIFKRQRFLGAVEPGTAAITYLVEQAKELVAFIAHLKMGTFYSSKIEDLTKDSAIYFYSLSDDAQMDRQRQDNARAYREKLIKNRADVERLLVEMIVYQGWAPRNLS
jgi:hypothetical protein